MTIRGAIRKAGALVANTLPPNKAEALDPDFPSVVVGGGGPAVDDRAAEYGQKPKRRPDFVLDDEVGWDAPRDFADES